MATGLTCVGVVWAALSLTSATVASVSFYMPFWIQGTILDQVETYFGSFRRCNYPRIVPDTGEVTIVRECGRYTSFADIPSVSWQICTIVVGVGCSLALLVAFTACLACCLTDIIDKFTAKVAGAIQLISAVFVVVGCAIYPNGWHSPEVREACGGKSEAFELGTCSISWSFYALGASAAVTLLCSTLSLQASKVKCRSYRV